MTRDVGEVVDVVTIPLSAGGLRVAVKAAQVLRAADLRVRAGLAGRGLRAQLRGANAVGARYAVIIGDDEVARGVVQLKVLADGGEQFEVAVDDLALRVGMEELRRLVPNEWSGGVSERTTFAEQLEDFAASYENAGEITHCAIGEYGWGGGWGKPGYDEGRFGTTPIPWEKRGVALPWVEARELLSYISTHGFGSPDCHAVVAWTSGGLVLSVAQYDGSTSFFAVPGQPRSWRPEMPGG